MDKHENEVVKLYLQGFTMHDVHLKVGISIPAVSKIVNRTMERWRTQTMDNVQAMIFQELEGLNRQEACLWEEWEFSRVKTVTIKPEKGSKAKPEVQRIQVEGNPVWMAEITKVKRTRLEVLGAIGSKASVNVMNVKAEQGSQVNVDPEFWTKLYTVPTEECPVEAEILKVKALPPKEDAT